MMRLKVCGKFYGFGKILARLISVNYIILNYRLKLWDLYQ